MNRLILSLGCNVPAEYRTLRAGDVGQFLRVNQQGGSIIAATEPGYYPVVDFFF